MGLELTDDGVLPVGVYKVTLQQLSVSRFVNANEHRRMLFISFQELVERLWKHHKTSVFVNGSYLTDMNCPGDIDAFVVISPFTFLSLLNDLGDDWDPRKMKRETGTGEHLLMWFRCRVEIFAIGSMSDWTMIESGMMTNWHDLFSQRKEDGLPKGYLEIVPNE